MKGLYFDAFNKLPPNELKPRGQPIQMNFFVESDHAGDRATRRSETGILLYSTSNALSPTTSGKILWRDQPVVRNLWL